MSASSAKRFLGNIEKYQYILETMEDVILVIDSKGKIEYVNRTFRKLVGETGEKKFTGTNIKDCPLLDEKLSKNILHNIFDEKSFVSRANNLKGAALHLSWRCKIFYRNKKKKALAVIRDLTSQISLQKKFEEYNENLQEMCFQRTQQLEMEKQKAVELHKAKAIFLSKMSHEIRTPLTAIRGYAELLKEPNLSRDDSLKYLSVIERNAEGLLEMIVQTLDMIQIEQNKYNIREQEFELVPLVQDIIDTFSVLAREKGLKLKSELSENIPQTIFSDPVAIRQILINLISNAIKYTEKGQVMISVKLRSVRKQGLKKLYFYIEDTGIGVPQEHRYRIFKSFEQYLDNQNSYTRGTGLGLSICKQLAKLLGGDVRLISSEENHGSTFVFSLPVRKKATIIEDV